MSGSGKNTQTFLIDTNVLVAAIRSPDKEKKTFRLIVTLIERDDIRIVGNHHLILEMYNYAIEFHSVTTVDLLENLIAKMDISQVGKNLKRVCRVYFETPRKADVLHAATCLKADAILITNDKDFDRIRDEEIIEVWSISEAIERLL
ncbi:MAG: type II toxin-antitoxin system VapC family toxin [Thermoplasmata archaeon]|nr:type II toxin-antitoxin system VapC family toxin [Thermoplasmata archaeon]